ncbi:hypothetical protein BH11CYA1_BH11CYA1_18100 [soil metagenome]
MSKSPDFPIEQFVGETPYTLDGYLALHLVCHASVDLAVPIAAHNNNNNIPIVSNKWNNSAELSGSLGSDQDVTSTAVSAIDYFLKAWKAVTPR